MALRATISALGRRRHRRCSSWVALFAMQPPPQLLRACGGDPGELLMRTQGCNELPFEIARPQVRLEVSIGWRSHRDAFTRGLFGAGSGVSAMTFARTVTSTSKVAAMSAQASSKRSL